MLCNCKDCTYHTTVDLVGTTICSYHKCQAIILILFAGVALGEPEAVWPFSPYYQHQAQPQHPMVINPWLSNYRSHHLPYQTPLLNHYNHFGRLYKRDAESYWSPYAASPYFHHMGMGMGMGMGMQYPYHHPAATSYQVQDEVVEDPSAQTPASTSKITYAFPHLQRHVMYGSPYSQRPYAHHRLFTREAESDADSDAYYPFFNRHLFGYQHRGVLPHALPYRHHWNNRHAGFLPYHSNLFGRRFF